MRSAEYPVGRRPAELVFIDAYRTPTGWGLECVGALPAGAVVRLSYTQPHVLGVDEDTIPMEHRMAVAQYAAWLLCQQLATRYSGERETPMGAEVARTETRARPTQPGPRNTARPTTPAQASLTLSNRPTWVATWRRPLAW